MRTYQVFNPKTMSWVKVSRLKDGTTRIKDVKKRSPTKPFKGVKFKE